MDAIHDVFCKLVVEDRDLGRIGNVKFYLLRSIKNRLVDISRHGRKLSYDDMAGHTFLADVSVGDDALMNAEEREIVTSHVKALMDKLTATQREAIYLRYMQEMEYDQIAILLGINPESVRKLVHRGLEKLRQQKVGFVTFIMLMYAIGEMRG